jgi:dienelactone hydrolase
LGEYLEPEAVAFQGLLQEPDRRLPRTKHEWILRRGDLRPRLLAALGLDPAPDRLPLQPRQEDPIGPDAVSIQRLHWQTWPEVWSGGWLLTPRHATGPGPALLFPGDAPPEWPLLTSLARRGFRILTVDRLHARNDAMGLSPLGVSVMAALRGLDLLAGRPEVDGAHLGLLGLGTALSPALFLLGLDERPRAAVLSGPVGYYRRYLGPLANGGEAPPAAEWVPGILSFTDQPEIIAMASPRALLLLTDPADPRNDHFEQQELVELRAIYRLWQQPDRLTHAFLADPEAQAGAWLEANLPGPEAPTAVPRPRGPDDLDAPGSQGPPTPVPLSAQQAATQQITTWYRERVVAQPPRLESRQSRRNYQGRVREGLEALLGRVPAPVPGQGLGPPVPLRDISEFCYRSERGVRLQASWVPTDADQPAPVLVVLHPEGPGAALRAIPPAAAAAHGFALLAPEVRLDASRSGVSAALALAAGRPWAGMAVTDVHAAVDWLFGWEGADPRRLAVLGIAELGVIALLAAGLDERIAAVAADCRGTTYRDGGEGLPHIPHILKVADVPQLASLAAPRAGWIYNVPPERVGFSSRRYYDWTRRSYQSLGADEALKMSTEAMPAPEALFAWLDTRLRRAARG